jgi:hypothetical protein
MGARAMEMKKVYVTLRALLDVLEILVGQSPTDRLHRQILEEVNHDKSHHTIFYYFVMILRNHCYGFVCGCILVY